MGAPPDPPEAGPLERRAAAMSRDAATTARPDRCGTPPSSTASRGPAARTRAAGTPCARRGHRLRGLAAGREAAQLQRPGEAVGPRPACSRTSGRRPACRARRGGTASGGAARHRGRPQRQHQAVARRRPPRGRRRRSGTRGRRRGAMPAAREVVPGRGSSGSMPPGPTIQRSRPSSAGAMSRRPARRWPAPPRRSCGSAGTGRPRRPARLGQARARAERDVRAAAVEQLGEARRRLDLTATSTLGVRSRERGQQRARPTCSSTVLGRPRRAAAAAPAGCVSSSDTRARSASPQISPASDGETLARRRSGPARCPRARRARRRAPPQRADGGGDRRLADAQLARRRLHGPEPGHRGEHCSWRSVIAGL